MKQASKSPKSDAEPAAAKQPPAPKTAAGVEASLGSRTTAALLRSHGAGHGKPLEPGVQKDMQSAFGEDFGAVRVHTSDGVPKGVRAATSGTHIVFGRGQYQPHSRQGQRLIAHELSHVVQQTKVSLEGTASSRTLERQAERGADVALAGLRPSLSRAPAQSLQFDIKPEDAASEMVGQTFEVIEAHTSGAVSLAKKDTVRIDAWDVDAIHSVKVTNLTGASKGSTLVVPQRILKPLYTTVAGVAPYSAGVEAQAKTVAKAETDLAAWQAKKAQYKTPDQQKEYAAEESRQQGLLTKRRNLLNRKQIQEQMYNRFDAVISKEVSAANKAQGLKGADKLDPNLVKALIFQESEMGTSGQHMSVPPEHPVKTRFNVAQVVDSSALALLTLMEREHAAIVAKYKLGNLRKDLAAAQSEKAALEKKDKRSAAEEARLAILKAKSAQNWETYIWQYVAPGETFGFNDAVNDLFASGGVTPLNVDYNFWIHIAVMWLFEKKKSGMTWEDAIKAYNGSGAKAEQYKKAVSGRATSAEAAQKAGTEFIPGR